MNSGIGRSGSALLGGAGTGGAGRSNIGTGAEISAPLTVASKPIGWSWRRLLVVADDMLISWQIQQSSKCNDRLAALA